MIETFETRAEFEKRREKARAALRSAMKGELPLEAVVPVKPKSESVITVIPTVITSETELCPKCKEILRLRTKRSRQKSKK